MRMGLCAGIDRERNQSLQVLPLIGVASTRASHRPPALHTQPSHHFKTQIRTPEAP